MKKFIEMLFGAKQHANARNIRGKKSSGMEDTNGYQHWKANYNDTTESWN